MIIFPSGIHISESDTLALENDLLSIEEWVTLAIEGKINNSYKLLTTEWIPRLLADDSVSAIAGNKESLISQIVNHPEYLNRREREVADGRAVN